MPAFAVKGNLIHKLMNNEYNEHVNKCTIVYPSEIKKSHTFRFYSHMVKKHLPGQKSEFFGILQTA